jgi:hypothetical protein
MLFYLQYAWELQDIYNHRAQFIRLTRAVTRRAPSLAWLQLWRTREPQVVRAVPLCDNLAAFQSQRSYVLSSTI